MSFQEPSITSLQSDGSINQKLLFAKLHCLSRPWISNGLITNSGSHYTVSGTCVHISTPLSEDFISSSLSYTFSGFCFSKIFFFSVNHLGWLFFLILLKQLVTTILCCFWFVKKFTDCRKNFWVSKPLEIKSLRIL